MTTTVPPLLSVIIPFLNEQDNLEPLLKDLQDCLRPFDYELILVDDGSSDCSLDIARALCNERIKVLALASRHGQSTAIKAGIDESTGTYIATIDADGQNPPEFLVPMMEMMLHANNAAIHMVQGERAKRKDNIIKRLPSAVGNAAIRLWLGVTVRDTGCSLRIFKRSMLTNMWYFNGFHRYLPVIAMMQGFKIQQMHVGHAPRISGSSKYGLERIPLVLYHILLLRLRPQWLATGLRYTVLNASSS